ncbi:predicted protein [Naegleria gruberi]|uniref:Predicted protein n=1 Tax=Naegleria gruberi TaxID=5762 RepID=D2VZX3_NAEGR|nr:uncharacterized protein NAEGRDRAFT_74650 [Naegleria gruberi]EFC37642.1 predicted protein [Naegleria gruberi]|eukprot:XP_002670386.1 predicted protein [Naegleria gruberi strain NEG-M]
MFFLVDLDKNIRLHPKFFGPDLTRTLRARLQNDVEGQCTGRDGYIVSVTEITKIGQGKIGESSGYATFPINYKAIVFKPFKGEVCDAVVYKVTPVGFFASVGPLNVFVSSHAVPDDMKYDGHHTPPRFISEEAQVCIFTTIQSFNMQQQYLNFHHESSSSI